MAHPNSNEPFWQGWQGSVLFINRLALAALVWWILTAGATDAWLVGLPVTVAAAALSASMLPPLRWTWRGAGRFWAYFLWESLRGGIDVASRAMRRHVPLDPGIVEHVQRTRWPAARVSLANTISLLPGTLAADLDDDVLYVHALDAGPEVRESLERSERRIAALFDVPLIAPEVDRGLDRAP